MGVLIDMNKFELFEEIEIQTIPLQIANAIRKKIYKGVLAPGDKIPKQEELAKLFSVSRPSIREALNLLVESHLIVRSPGRDNGYIVSDFHPEKALKNVHDIIVLSLTFKTLSKWDLFEMRKMIEVPCAMLAAERRTEKDLIELEDCLPKANILTKPVKDIFDADARFHIKLAECSQNPLAKTLVSSLILSYYEIRVEINTEEKKHIIEGLPDLFEAIKEQNVENAKKCIENHMNYFVRYHKQN